MDDGSGGDAEVTFRRVSIHDNEVGFGWGGGIYNEGQVTLIESVVSANKAAGGGGIDNSTS